MAAAPAPRLGLWHGQRYSGQLTLSLQGDTSQVEQVTFYFNDVKVFEQHEAPFGFSFNTDQFQPA